MKVHIERDWRDGTMRVFLFDRRHVFGLSERGHLVPVAERGEGDSATDVDPTLVIDGDALALIVAEAGKVLQATDATVDALNDARTVRDRLLALVEKGFE